MRTPPDAIFFKQNKAPLQNDKYGRAVLGEIRRSSHQTYRGYIDNHISPNIGNIPLKKLASLDLQ